MEYLDFEGIIPTAQYGAGTVIIWDTGSYNLLEGDDPLSALEAGKILLRLHGKILKGAFSLVRMKGRGEKNWLLIKKKDEHSQGNWHLQQALTKEKDTHTRD